MYSQCCSLQKARRGLHAFGLVDHWTRVKEGYILRAGGYISYLWVALSSSVILAGRGVIGRLGVVLDSQVSQSIVGRGSGDQYC